jgi:hypothetical protein
MTSNQTITDDQIADLLSMAAVIDYRKIGDAEVDLWHAIAVTHNWTWPLARRALIDHYAESRDRIMPADITRRIAEARRAVYAAFQIPPHSAELADDGRAFVAWAKERAAEHMAVGLGEWAAYGRLPQPLELEA